MRRCGFSLLLPAHPRFLSLGAAQERNQPLRTILGTAWRANGVAGCWSLLCAWAPTEVRPGLGVGLEESLENPSEPQSFPAVVFKLRSMLLCPSVVVELCQRRGGTGGTAGYFTSCPPGWEHCNFCSEKWSRGKKWFAPSLLWASGTRTELVFCQGAEGGRPVEVSWQQGRRGLRCLLPSVLGCGWVSGCGCVHVSRGETVVLAQWGERGATWSCPFPEGPRWRCRRQEASSGVDCWALGWVMGCNTAALCTQHLWRPLITRALGICEQILLRTSLCCWSPGFPPVRARRWYLAHPQEAGWEEPVSDPWSLLKGKLFIPGEIYLGKPQSPAVVVQKKALLERRTPFTP